MTHIESGFRGYHPFVIFFYYVCVGIVAMYLNHPIFLIIACILLIIVNCFYHSIKTLKRWIPMLIGMNLLIIFFNMFFVSKGEHILFSFWGRSVTLEATIFGVVMALSITLISLLFISFNHLLNGNKFLFVFSKFLPRTAFLTMLAVRFVPLLKKRLDEITDVQRIKGLTIASGTVRQRCKDGMTLIQILLTWSLEEAVETADSMKTRGYGIGTRSPYIPYKLIRRDQIWLGLLLCFLLFCLVGGAFGYGRMEIYPTLSSFRLTWFDGLLLLHTIIILAFPLLVEGGEQLRWKFFR